MTDPSQDYATRTVAEAEQLLAAGKVRRALGKLRSAAANVRATTPTSEAVLERIRKAAEAAAQADNGRHARTAEEVISIAVGREESIRQMAAQQSSNPVEQMAVQAATAASPGDPWFYGAAHLVARVSITASVLSVIGGVVVGIEVSKYRAFDAFGGIATHHHPGVIAYWIAIGVFTAAVWLALAVGIELLADVGRSLRACAAADGTKSA